MLETKTAHTGNFSITKMCASYLLHTTLYTWLLLNSTKRIKIRPFCGARLFISI